MTATSGDHAGRTADSTPRPRLGVVLAGLCVTEIVSWGVLYYAFPILAPAITADTGWSPTFTTAAFSASLVLSALIGIPVGRALDHRGPRAIMTAGSVLAVAAVCLIAFSPHPLVFFAGWLLAGIAMAGVLYQPAFAALSRWYGPRRLTALTAVTLVAGLASTVFAPVAEALGSQLSWRGVYLTLAALLALVTIPIHAVVLRRPWPPDHHADPHTTDRAYAATIIRSRGFLALAVGFTAASVAMYAVVINLVPLLAHRGYPPATAAWALALGGIGQVTGRLLYTPLVTRLNLGARTGVVFGLGTATTGALAVISGPAGLLLAIAAAAGFARGISTLLQATAIPDRWGPRNYGRISAVLAAPVTLATALAPWIGVSIAALTGYPTMFACLAVIGALAAVLLTATTPRAGSGT